MRLNEVNQNRRFQSKGDDKKTAFTRVHEKGPRAKEEMAAK
jgi:hypothetical protein